MSSDDDPEVRALSNRLGPGFLEGLCHLTAYISRLGPAEAAEASFLTRALRARLRASLGPDPKTYGPVIQRYCSEYWKRHPESLRDAKRPEPPLPRRTRRTRARKEIAEDECANKGPLALLELAVEVLQSSRWKTARTRARFLWAACRIINRTLLDSYWTLPLESPDGGYAFLFPGGRALAIDPQGDLLDGQFENITLGGRVVIDYGAMRQWPRP